MPLMTTKPRNKHTLVIDIIDKQCLAGIWGNCPGRIVWGNVWGKFAEGEMSGIGNGSEEFSRGGAIF